MTGEISKPMRRKLNRRQRLLCIAIAICAVTLEGMPKPNAAPMCYKERFKVNGDEVSDAATSLIWKRQPEIGRFNWESAKGQCMGGWRLPSIGELQSIVDDSKSNPAIDNAFGTQLLDYFWSSSPLAGSPSLAWAVDFSTGGTGGSGVGDAYRVRCVR
jgi:hypothetical protein